MIKHSIIFLLFLLISQKAIAQGQGASFYGVVLKKEWTKTTESYCAGGSDYYVLKTDKEEIVLQRKASDKANAAFFGKWIGKKVALIGRKIEKKIKNDNPLEQKPVSFSPDGKQTDEAFSCWIIQVMSIRKGS